MNPTRSRIVVAMFASVLGVVGCGDSRDRSSSQTAAKVNGDEITVHQINTELRRTMRGNPAEPSNPEAANKRILESLIDQTLLVQQAKEAKLDRDPQVLEQLEASRRQILAQAYIDRQVAANPPTQEEIKAFFAKNPDLFEHRKVYAFREFLFERGKFTESLRQQLDKAKTPADVAKILADAGIRYRETNSTRPAEALPLEALPRIAKMAKGDTVVFSDQNLTNVLMLLDSAEQPVPFERATPLIQQFLVNQKRREFAQNAVKELRAKAKVEYSRGFSKDEGDAKAADVKLPEATQTPEPQPQTDKSTQNDKSIQKGLSGLR